MGDFKLIGPVATVHASKRRLTIVVPAFNEVAHIEAALTVVSGAAARLLDDYEIIVVDDGSSDGTGAVAEQFAASHPHTCVKRQPVNQGVGAAYLYGLREARFPYLTLVPGDNVFSRVAVENVFEAVGRAPLVVSYRDNMEVRTRIRHALSIICTTSMRLICGRRIRDAHSMYVFPVDIARAIPVQPGYGYHIESLGRLLCLVPDFVEVPTPLNPRPDASSGVMKIGVVWLLGLTMLRLAGWRIVRRCRSFLFSAAVIGEETTRLGRRIPEMPAGGAVPLFEGARGGMRAVAGRHPYFDVRVGLIILIALAFTVALFVARDFGLSRSDPSSRMRLHAIPVAISQIYHGRVHDYTAFWSIAMRFHNQQLLDTAIDQAVHADIPPGDRTYYWTADDRGLSDFVNVAFRLFGPKMRALFNFWFLLLGLSVIAAILRYRQDPIALAAIACSVIGIGAVLPALTRAAGEGFGEPSIHISESRMFDILGIVALLHLLLAMLRPSATPRWLDVATLIAQAGLIALLIHARTSVSWLFLAILSIGLVLAVLRLKGRGRPPQSGVVLAVSCTVLVAWTGVHLYQRAAFNPAYFGEIGPRTFWHNALMGLGQNFVLSRKLNVVGSDSTAVDAVLLDMKTRNDSRLTEQWQTQNILNSLGSSNTFDWRAYEDVARDLYFRTLFSDPWQATRLFVWDKPGRVVALIGCEFLLLTCDASRFSNVRFPVRPITLYLPWIWVALLALVAASLCASRRVDKEMLGATESNGSIVLLLLLAALIGLAPAIIVYPAVPQLGGTVVLLLTDTSFALVLVAQRLSRGCTVQPEVGRQGECPP